VFNTINNIFEILRQRGFFEQSNNFTELKKILDEKKIIFYTGFDPTADSLTVGHFIPIMVMSHMQYAGHTPIFLIGGGTATIGDPTDRTEMRRIMSRDEINNNVECFKNQAKNLINFDKAILLNNFDWLSKLNYLDFISQYGNYFSINRMLTADAYRTRFERGLSFYELNYMPMQAYDFLYLNKNYDCVLQIGGNDQWSNILAGVDLIRRVDKKNVFGLTLKLLTKSDGTKMGKTAGGAIWLDKNKTTPFDFFQYWRNIDDSDVENCLKLLTFIELDKIKDLLININEAKEILAFEITKIIHGEKEAYKSLNIAKTLFSTGNFIDQVPSVYLKKSLFNNGLDISDLLLKIKLVSSKSDARRLISQGGIKIDSKKILDIKYIVNLNDFKDDIIIVQKGKKDFKRIKVDD
jgi:tyrosyl-tRNA synthetase